MVNASFTSIGDNSHPVDASCHWRKTMTMHVNPAQNKGFTLIELMITVAIIGVLAAIAIPTFSLYVAKSKASEAAITLQGIRESEESYYTNMGKRYSNNLDWNPPLENNCECTTNTRFWDMPADGPWVALGFNPGGPTYYSFRVTTNYENGVRVASDPSTSFSSIGTTWPPNTAAWFVVEACGDVDCDHNVAHFFISSHSHDVFHQEAKESYY